MEFTLIVHKLSAKMSIASGRRNLKRSLILRFEERSDGYRNGEYEHRMIRSSSLMIKTTVHGMPKNYFVRVFYFSIINVAQRIHLFHESKKNILPKLCELIFCVSFCS